MKRLLLAIWFLFIYLVQANAQCTAEFQFFTQGLTVDFRDSSFYSPNSSIIQNWNYGDSNVGFGANTTHTYVLPGTYTVCLTIYDSLQTCFDTICKSVTVTACATSFTYLANANNLVNFTGTVTGVASPFRDSWVFGNGTSRSSFPAQNPLIKSEQYANPGNYVVTLTITGPNAVTCSFTDTINVNTCSANFSYQLGSNGTVNFINQSSPNSPNISYNWNFGDSSVSTLKNPIHNYAQTGAYTVTLFMYDSASNCSSQKIDTIWVNVPPPCQAGFNYQSNFTQVDFFNQAVNYTFILYKFGDGDSSSLGNPTHNYSAPGTYIVRQMVLNQNNCLSVFTDTITIIEPAPCLADFSYNTVGDTTEFTSNSSNYTRLIYYFGDGDSSTSQNPRHIYSTSGTYTVQLVVFNDTTNCVDSTSKTIAVTVSQSCVAKFALALDTNQRKTLFLINTSSSDNTHQYLWDFGDGNSSVSRLPTHQYAQNRAYNICLTVFDTVQNCTSTYCDSVGLDTNGNILKSAGFNLRVLNGSVIGIKEESLENMVSIYPNPFNNVFTIKTTFDAREIDYQVFNSSGILLYRGQINSKVKQVEVINSSPGIYFLRLMYNGKTTVKRIVKI